MNSKPIVGLAAIALVAIALSDWTLAARGNEANVTAVIAEWSAYIPAVSCNFLKKNANNATVITLEGSGMLVRVASGAMGVVATASLLSRDGQIADACHVDFEGGPSYTIPSKDIRIDPQPAIEARFILLSGEAASQTAPLAQNVRQSARHPGNAGLDHRRRFGRA